jgi:hypothetical protein
VRPRWLAELLDKICPRDFFIFPGFGVSTQANGNIYQVHKQRFLKGKPPRKRLKRQVAEPKKAVVCAWGLCKNLFIGDKSLSKDKDYFSIFTFSASNFL